MSLSEWLRKTFIGITTGTWEKPSPADIVSERAISIVDTKITIDLAKTHIPFAKAPFVYALSVTASKSMDGIVDYGNHLIYIRPLDAENHKIMVDWIAKTWEESKGFQTVDIAYRIPPDFSKPVQAYNIHRLVKVSYDSLGRFFTFKGVNNPVKDSYKVRDENIIMLAVGQIN